MTSDRDPPRLRISSDSSAHLAEALEAARSELPRAEALREIETSLLPLFSKTEKSVPASLRPVAAGAAATFKLLMAAVVAAASVGGAVHYFRSAAPERPSSPTAAPMKSATEPRRVRPEPPTESEQAAPSAAETEESAASAVTAAKPPGRTEPPAVAGTAPSTSASSAGAFPDATESAEVALLERATRVLGANPNQSLALTEEHARKFPMGALTQEREFVAIEALLALGRSAEADRRIDQFKAQFPGSAHLRRLQRLRGSGADDAP